MVDTEIEMVLVEVEVTAVDHEKTIHGREHTKAMDTKKILASCDGIRVNET
jgi:hypothetical protein